MSGQKPATTNDLRGLIEWMTGDDCGLSSTTIACVMAGAACARPATPADDGDLGRCIRLLERFPQFRGRLVDVADTHPEWEPIIFCWEALKTAHEAGDAKEVNRLLQTASAKATARLRTEAASK